MNCLKFFLYRTFLYAVRDPRVIERFVQIQEYIKYRVNKLYAFSHAIYSHIYIYIPLIKSSRPPYILRREFPFFENPYSFERFKVLTLVKYKNLKKRGERNI